MTVGVDASGDEHAGGGDAAAFADLHRQRIDPHEGVRRAVQRPGSPCLDDLVKVGADPADLAPADAVDAHRPRHVIDAAGRYALDVALRYDGAQRLFRPPAGVEEAREVAARPQLGDAQLHRARAGVPVAVAVAVALRGPLVRGAFAVRGADLGGDLRLHQRLGQHTHALAQEVDVAALGVADQLHQLHRGDCHRVPPRDVASDPSSSRMERWRSRSTSRSVDPPAPVHRSL